MNEVEEMKKKRFQFLYRLYKLTGGDEFKEEDMFKIGKELGFDKDLTDKIVQYLKGEGLIEFRAMGGIIGITHRGTHEIEEALSKSDTPTEHFPPINIISIGQMTNSQIQQANTESTQIASFSGDRGEKLIEFIQLLEESKDKLDLEPQQKSDLQSEVQTIRAQMSSSKPKDKVITECLNSIKRILEGAAVNIFTSRLLDNITALLGGDKYILQLTKCI
ncbi:MAG TPA: hypothetical protein PK487_05610 [bacterium]|nr:hypothetical protein [bacterium]